MSAPVRRTPTELQLKVLTCLQYAPRGLTIGEIGRAMFQSYTDTERRMHTLEKRGWVARRKAPRGRRARYVFQLAFDAEFMQELVSRVQTDAAAVDGGPEHAPGGTTASGTIRSPSLPGTSSYVGRLRTPR